MFTARRLDEESGIYYYRARMYHPELGRFLQPDPIGYYDSMNLYQYCLNNSVNYIDPWGFYHEYPKKYWKDVVGGDDEALKKAIDWAMKKAWDKAKGPFEQAAGLTTRLATITSILLQNPTEMDPSHSAVMPPPTDEVPVEEEKEEEPTRSEG